MALTLQRLNYPALLAMPSKEAFLSALSTEHCIDFVKYICQYGLVLQPPVAVNGASPEVTQAVFHDPACHMSDAPVEYLRLELGGYLKSCSLYAPQSAATSVDALVDWFHTAHGLYFIDTDLTLTEVDSPCPDDPLVSGLKVSINDGNYVWTGEAILRIVPTNHLALFAKPGTATGIRLGDVGFHGCYQNASSNGTFAVL